MQYRVREQSELKPSGVEWLGDIPKDWKKVRLKRLINYSIGGSWGNNKNNDENDILCFRIADMDYDKLIFKLDNLTVRNIKKNEVSSRILNQNDLVIEKSGGGEKTPVGRVILYNIESKAVCSNFMNKINLNMNIINSKYLVLLFSVLYSKRVVLNSIKQTTGIQNLNIPNYFMNYSPFPPLVKQQKIVKFLDKKNKFFDDALLKKEKLIKKLESAKESLISEVVSGKLKIIEKDGKLQSIKREENKLKPSGVEWLGNIPKEWEVKKSKYLFKIQKRIAGKLGYDILSITKTGIKVKDITTGGGQLSMDYSKYQIVNVGDFAMNHMDLLTGFVDIAKTQGVTSPDYRVFSLFDKNSVSTYYLYLFQMGYKNRIFYTFGQGSSQLGRWRLPAEEFKKFYFPYPSKDEQKQIAKYLDVKIKVFNKTIAKTKQSILKLKQAKESLISEAVTGKIEIIEEKAKASSYFQRRVLAAYFIDNSLDDEYFGRVKLQKMLYMAEAVNDLDFNSDYKRHAMGPYDPNLMKSIESQLKKAKWFGNKKLNDFGKIKYFALDKSNDYKIYLDGRYFKQENIEYIYNLLKGMKTLQTEIVATVYSAYKDLKEENRVSKKNLLDEILNNWHDNKKKVSQEKWEKAINWLNEKRLINI